MTKWRVVLKPTEDHVLDEFVLVDTADYVLGFVATVLASGWTVLDVKVDYNG